jgi:HD-GYP domain-containing protein (c-di-GMP phosphodiesterase class II)
LTGGGLDQQGPSPAEAIQSLRCNSSAPYDPKVLNALESIVTARGAAGVQVALPKSMATFQPVTLD